MARKVLSMVTVLCLLLILPTNVTATGDTAVQIMPSCGGDGILGGKITVYCVAEPSDKGYKLTDGMANWFIRDQDALAVDFAKWIIQRRREQGITQPVSVNGSVFLNLKPGIYLAQQSTPADGYYPFNPFLFTVTEYDHELFAYPKITPLTPQTGDSMGILVGGIGFIGSVVGILLCALFKKGAIKEK